MIDISIYHGNTMHLKFGEKPIFLYGGNLVIVKKKSKIFGYSWVPIGNKELIDENENEN